MCERPMTTEAATLAAKRLSIIPFAPAGDFQVIALAEEIFAMCPTIESSEFVVRRAKALWKKWEGPSELRAILCSKYKPKDGQEADTMLWTDGVPPENPEATAFLGSPGGLFLPPTPEEIERKRAAEREGGFSADPELDALIRRLAEKTRAPKRPPLDLKAMDEEIARVRRAQNARRRESEPPKDETEPSE